MASGARLFGHPIHPMLIVFPLGLFTTAVAFDVLYLVRDNPKWGQISYWMIAAGMIGAVAAALFGVIDWLAIPKGTRAKKVGLFHGAGNAIVLLLFAMSWFFRMGEPSAPTPVAIATGVIAVLIAAVTGWMGGELVNRLGVGVDTGAHLNAPSSLSSRPVSEDATRRQVGSGERGVGGRQETGSRQ